MADILVADDTESVRTALSILLEENGHSVRFASDGEEALSQYGRKRPELLLLDIMMPKKNGYQVLKRIRRADPALPVVFLSAKGSPADVALGLDLGSDDYLPKPFDDEVLISRINAVLRRSGFASAKNARTDSASIDGFAFGSHRVDLKRHLMVDSDGNETSLSVREMGMLRRFAEHPEEVLSRDALLDEFWYLGTKVTTRVLDQAVNVLRRKLGKDSVLIDTVHGAGYRYPGGKDELIALCREVMPDCEVKLMRHSPPVNSDPDHPLIKRLQRVMETHLGHSIPLSRMLAATDARWFTTCGVPIALMGSKGGGAHAVDEYAFISSLDDTTEYLKTFFLGNSK